MQRTSSRERDSQLGEHADRGEPLAVLPVRRQAKVKCSFDVEATASERDDAKLNR